MTNTPIPSTVAANALGDWINDPTHDENDAPARLMNACDDGCVVAPDTESDTPCVCPHGYEPAGMTFYVL